MNLRTRFLAIAVFVAASCSPIDNLHSQNAAANAAPAATVQPGENADAVDPAETKSVGGMIISGGTLNVVFFGILGVFSLWAATVVLERMFNLRREKLLPDAFATQLALLIQSPQTTPKNFQALCEIHDSPASRILRAGGLRDGRPLPEIEKAMEDAAAREMATIRAKSRPLSVVGNIAPLVGLLGTVVGMIMAFQISSQEGLGKAERLAEGIYLALMTTAAGLSIAIPCLLFASWFQGKAERYMCEIAECLAAAIPSFGNSEGKSAAMVQPTAPRSLDGAQSPAMYRKQSDEELSARERFIREGVIDTAR